jgi:hypothetical protein
VGTWGGRGGQSNRAWEVPHSSIRKQKHDKHKFISLAIVVEKKIVSSLLFRLDYWDARTEVNCVVRYLVKKKKDIIKRKKEQYIN